MKRVMLCVVFLLVIMPMGVSAQRGCCSHHGGVAYCGSRGKYICNDGTTSPTCTCSGGASSNSNYLYSRTVQRTVTPVYGCTNKNALNYNSNANKDDGSCIAIVWGCMDKSAYNYNENANKDDGSCIAKKYGCMDSSAINYDASANTDNYSCKYKKTIVDTKKTKYETKYKDNDDLVKGNERVLVKGKKGKKEVTYDAIVDKDGKIISKEVTSEEVIEKPIDKVIERGTKEASSIPALLWIISLAISFWYSFKHKDGNLLLNKISNTNQPIKFILYFTYVVLIIPAFVDIIIVFINLLNHLFCKTNN